jgi:hypothetical protein
MTVCLLARPLLCQCMPPLQLPAAAANTACPRAQSVRARILFVDPLRKRIGLTLKENLIALQAFEFPASVRVGDIFDSAEVARVDEGSGLLLRVALKSRRTAAGAEGKENAADNAEEEEDGGSADAGTLLAYAHVREHANRWRS